VWGKFAGKKMKITHLLFRLILVTIAISGLIFVNLLRKNFYSIYIWILLFLGSFSNLLVVFCNKGYMPIYKLKPKYRKKFYKVFKDKKKVKLWFLSDVIPLNIEFKTKKHIFGLKAKFSVGDVFLNFACITALINLIFELI